MIKPFLQTKYGALYCGDSEEVLRDFPPGFFTSMVTDPPYGLKFKNQAWDYSVPGSDLWKEVLRVLRPGAHASIFAGSRTQHRMAVSVEDAGFQLKDTLMWLYGSGFPKGVDISKQIDKAEPATPEAELWDGWRTCLKPAYEPIILAMKANAGSYAQNAQEHGVAGMNIEGCRIESSEITGWGGAGRNENRGWALMAEGEPRPVRGRFPANIILDEQAAGMLDAQSGFSKSGHPRGKLAGKKMDIWAAQNPATLDRPTIAILAELHASSMSPRHRYPRGTLARKTTI